MQLPRITTYSCKLYLIINDSYTIRNSGLKKGLATSKNIINGKLHAKTVICRYGLVNAKHLEEGSVHAVPYSPIYSEKSLEKFPIAHDTYERKYPLNCIFELSSNSDYRAYNGNCNYKHET